MSHLWVLPPPRICHQQIKMFVVPEVGIVHQINDKLTFGIGAFGVSGMGVDYRNKDPAVLPICIPPYSS